ncbi:MAG TPA: 6-phosphogluconolactonase [Rudaea sp.]|nr:6-phosphogluconolactonase [Rudaea sp.]
MTPIFRRFADRVALAHALAETVAERLRAGIAVRGRGLLAVSGGNTPRLFLETLAAQRLSWSDVTVTLADERWVPPEHDRSNERLVRETLLRGAAAAARFVPLYAPAPAPEDALAQIAANIAKLALPFDAVVLGMGEDGHCASLFPDGDRLEEAIQPDAFARVMPMRAPSAGEPRITLTLPVLVSTRTLCLHIEGERKKSIFERAVAGQEPFAQAPIRSVLAHAREPAEVFWCP